MIPELFKQCGCAPGKWAKCDHPFHFRKQVKGRRWKVSLDEWLGHDRIRSVTAAEDVAAQMIAALKAGTFTATGPTTPGAAPPVPIVPGGHTFASVAATYLALADADPERTKQYRKSLRSILTRITRWPIPDHRELLGALPITAVDNALLERWYKTQVADGLSVSYRNKQIQVLRAFSRWAVRDGYRPTAWLEPGDPGVTITRRKGARRDRRLALPVLDARGRVLVAGEYERLLAVAEPRLRDLCVATMECGARLAELQALQWRAVDLPRRLVTLADSKDPDRVKTRVLPISPTLQAVFERRRWAPDETLQPPEAYVFGNAVGERGAKLARTWQTAVLRAHGQPAPRSPKGELTAAACAAYHAINLKFHDLRHEAASRWYESGALQLTDIMFVLGHTSLETTQIYLNIRPEGLADKLAAFARAQAATGHSGLPVAYEPKLPPARRLKLAAKNGRKARQGSELA